MPFIGVQPASALLTSADIQDGQITTAKVADDAITGAKIENSPTIANGITLTDGDITFASGHGIDFSATGNTSATNASTSNELLDDYEEGTWTPVYTPETNSFTSISYKSNTFGTYTKVGRQVTLVCTVDVDTLTIGSATNTLFITGIPFSALDAEASYSGAVSQQTQWGEIPTQVMIKDDDNIFMGYRASATSYTSIRVSDMDESGGSNAERNRIRFTLTYFVN